MYFVSTVGGGAMRMAFRPQHLAGGSVMRPLAKEAPVKAKAPASKRKKNGTASRDKL